MEDAPKFCALKIGEQDLQRVIAEVGVGRKVSPVFRRDGRLGEA